MTEPDRFLAKAASPVLSDVQAGLLREALPRVQNWPGVLAAGYRHGVIPLLHAHLSALNLADCVPAEAWAALSERRLRSTRHALLMASELARLLSRLTEEGVQVLPLKGASVGQRLYAEPGLRESGDLDVMVLAADVHAAIRLVSELGYRPWEALPKNQSDIRLRTEYSVAFTHPETDVDIDLHWNFARSVFPTGLSPELMFNRAMDGTLQGQPVRVLSPEDLLLVLSIHGCKHGPTPWPKLKWIGDVAGFVHRYPDLDWTKAFAGYEQARASRMVLLGLSLAHQLLGSDLPEAAKTRAGFTPRLSAAAAQCSAAVLAGGAHFTLAERMRFDLAIQSSAMDRIRVVWKRLVTPTRRDRNELDLPPSLRWLYLPVRAGRLLRHYLLRPSRIARLWNRAEPRSKTVSQPTQEPRSP